MPSNVKLGGFDFVDCEHLESAILSEGLETIEGIFYGCKNLKSVKLPNSLKKIGKYAFIYCEKLTFINLPENISYIGEKAFADSGIESINLPKNLIEIDSTVFCRTKLKNIIIPNNVKNIKRRAFMESALESITIPSSVEYIGSQAFAYCKNLKTVNILGNTTKMSTTAFHLSPASIIYNGSKQNLKNSFIDADNYDDFEYFPKNIVYKTESAQNLESILAESFEKTIKNLQKEGLFENVKSFDLDFTGKGINIKLNEGYPGDRYESFKKISNLKENESNEVTYMQDFSIEDYYNDITEVEAAASDLGISISFYEGSGNDGWDEICAKASSEEVLKQFLYDWDLIENDDDFEAGLL